MFVVPFVIFFWFEIDVGIADEFNFWLCHDWVDYVFVVHRTPKMIYIVFLSLDDSGD